VEIEREVVSQDSVFKDIVEKAFVAGSEPDGVVGEVGVGPVGSKVDEEKGHAVTHRIEFAVSPFMSSGCGYFFLIEISDVGIGDNDVSAKRFARAEPDSRRRPVFDEKLVHGGVEANFAAKILKQFDQGLNQGSGSTHCEVNAPFALEIVNHGVDGRGLERIATDEKRMEGEDFTKALRLDVARGHLPYRAIRTESDEVGSDSKHIGEGGEGLIGKFDEGFLEDGVGFSYKTAVAFEVVGKVLANLGLHFRLVAGVLEGLPVVPSDPVERFAGNDFNVIGSFFARESKQLIEEERRGEDSGAGVVGESFVTKNGGAATRLFKSFE